MKGNMNLYLVKIVVNGPDGSLVPSSMYMTYHLIVAARPYIPEFQDEIASVILYPTDKIVIQQVNVVGKCQASVQPGILMSSNLVAYELL